MRLTDSDKEFLKQYEKAFSNHEEAEEYLNECWGRNEIVMSWLGELHVQGVKEVLELGSNPYFLTLLMQKYFDFNLHLANYFGDSSRNGRQKDAIDVNEKTHTFEYEHFNIEKDRFPYDDSCFDLVLFCEIIEHLLLTVDAPLAEIYRILKPGGYVIISTPNAVRLANLAHLARGKNIYPGYSPHGAYGRHNREYSLLELEQLLNRHGFVVAKTQVVDFVRYSWKRRLLESLRPNMWRDYLFVMGRK